MTGAVVLIRKILMFLLGIVFLIAGVIGLLLPVIPQVPFLVASALCFAAISKRIHARVTHTSIYQKHLQRFVEQNDLLNRLFNHED